MSPGHLVGTITLLVIFLMFNRWFDKKGNRVMDSANEIERQTSSWSKKDMEHILQRKPGRTVND